ncbi:hypothetical protein Aperf_G00000054517 [Anoplocephala perfoliata]
MDGKNGEKCVRWPAQQSPRLSFRPVSLLLLLLLSSHAIGQPVLRNIKPAPFILCLLHSGTNASQEMIKAQRLPSTSFLLHLLLLPFIFQLVSARRTTFYVHGLKFSRPCVNNTYDEYTGNFKCTVETGAQCFKLCQQYGCYEWSFSSFMPSRDENPREHYRCRCIQDICLYNYVRVRDRDYE